MPSFGRLLAPVPRPQPEPFDHRLTRRSLLDASDAQLGQSSRVIRDRGQKIWSVLKNDGRAAESREILLSLGLEFDTLDIPEGVADRRLDILALIHWGQGGTQFRAEVDWRNGVQISVPAANVQVDAQFLEPADPGTFRSATVKAGYTWGCSTNRSFPTRTFPKVLIADGGAAIFPVPPFAFSFFVFLDDTGGTATTLGGPALTDRAFDSYSTAELDAARDTEGLRLPGAARFLAVIAPPEQDASATVMFALNL